jgi:hypothetical protein
MEIKLTQKDAETALRAYLSSRGIAADNATFSFSMTRAKKNDDNDEGGQLIINADLDGAAQAIPAKTAKTVEVGNGPGVDDKPGVFNKAS